tara:strand:- start:382 stop:756 length:375 start_codon:yes stop_codon:yes gene_type:complete
MEKTKNRHGCLTAWLVWMAFSNSLLSLVYLFGGDIIRQLLPNIAEWTPRVLSLFGLFNVVCVVALFKWKKWGFWGFCVSSICVLAINLSSGIGMDSFLMTLFGVAILFGVLNIGDDNKGWRQLV